MQSFSDIPHVILATTIRHPIDRWYSQYRFEHLEHRDGTDGKAPRQTLRQFYDSMKGWTMGVNYYIKTFIGDPDPRPPRNTVRRCYTLCCTLYCTFCCILRIGYVLV